MKSRLVQRTELSQEQIQTIRLTQKLKAREAESKRCIKMLNAAEKELSKLNDEREKDPIRAMKLEADCELAKLAFEFFEGKRQEVVREFRGEESKS